MSVGQLDKQLPSKQRVGCSSHPSGAIYGARHSLWIDFRRTGRYALFSAFRWGWTAFSRTSFPATIAVLLTLGLFFRSAAAPAAGRSDPDAKLSPLVLRLYGGFTRAEAGDINEGLDGYFEVLELYPALGLGMTTGAFRPLRDGRNSGADLVFQITPHVGIGIGAGYLRFSKSSSITFTDGSGSVELSAAPAPTPSPSGLACSSRSPSAGGRI